MALKLITLNIEKNKHLEKFLPCIEQEQPDVLCLQELLERDVEYIASTLKMHKAFAPYCIHAEDSAIPREVQGIGLFSKLSPKTAEARYYFRSEDDYATCDETYRDATAQPLLLVSLEKDDKTYHVGTTHFMKSYHGVPDTYQRARMMLFLECIAHHPDVLFCGDFNIPRGTELYHVLRERYTDHVPPEYTRSLDPELHRRPDLEYMVDYIWSTPDYVAENVRMICGLSDHCAIVGEVSRR